MWLATRMTKLGTAITEAIVYDYGTSAFLSRLEPRADFDAVIKHEHELQRSLF